MNQYYVDTLKNMIAKEVEEQLQEALHRCYIEQTEESQQKAKEDTMKHPEHYKHLVRSVVDHLYLLTDHLKELDELCEKCHGCSQCPLGSLVQDHLCIRSILKYEKHTIEECYDLCKQRAERMKE